MEQQEIRVMFKQTLECVKIETAEKMIKFIESYYGNNDGVERIVEELKKRFL